MNWLVHRCPIYKIFLDVYKRKIKIYEQYRWATLFIHTTILKFKMQNNVFFHFLDLCEWIYTKIQMIACYLLQKMKLLRLLPHLLALEHFQMCQSDE